MTCSNVAFVSSEVKKEKISEVMLKATFLHNLEFVICATRVSRTETVYALTSHFIISQYQPGKILLLRQRRLSSRKLSTTEEMTLHPLQLVTSHRQIMTCLIRRWMIFQL